MNTETKFDYCYKEESGQLSFCRIPRQLITVEAFKGLSTDAKLLYALMLERMGLSAQNGWHDEYSRIYIYYIVNEIRAVLNCGNDKAIKLLPEPDTVKGIGLIERVKQGQGKPTKIFCKELFQADQLTNQRSKFYSGSQPRRRSYSRLRLYRSLDCGFPALLAAAFPQSRHRESRM